MSIGRMSGHKSGQLPDVVRIAMIPVCELLIGGVRRSGMDEGTVEQTVMGMTMTEWHNCVSIVMPEL